MEQITCLPRQKESPAAFVGFRGFDVSVFFSVVRTQAPVLPEQTHSSRATGSIAPLRRRGR